MTGPITIEAPTAEQESVLAGWLDDARGCGIDLDDLQSISDGYDGYVQQVLEQDPDDREDPTPFCTMIGMAMGEYLVRRTDLRWRVITDDQGTDLGLANPQETGILFPADPVAGAWEEQQTGWMPGWVAELTASLAEPQA